MYLLCLENHIVETGDVGGSLVFMFDAGGRFLYKAVNCVNHAYAAGSGEFRFLFWGGYDFI